MSSPDFGDKFRNLRLEARVTLKDVAQALGFSIPYVSDVERGRRNPFSDEKIRAATQLFKMPQRAEELIELAAAQRGGVTIKSDDEQTQQMLVALNRRIESRELDPGIISKIRELLSRKDHDQSR